MTSTQKQVLKAMKRDAEIHERGHLTAKEREDIQTVRFFNTHAEKPSWVMEVVAELIEAPAKK
jgi:hypothetical protein